MVFMGKGKGDNSVQQTWGFAACSCCCFWQAVSGNGEGTLSLVTGGIVCCSFLQRILRKWPEEPLDLWVRISGVFRQIKNQKDL